MTYNMRSWYRQLRRVGKSTRDAYNIAGRLDRANCDCSIWTNNLAKLTQDSFDYVLRSAKVDFSKGAPQT